MRIKSVKCEQFAGLQGSELEFDNGLNLVVGENESGKSTMTDLIYQLLFKDIKLGDKAKGDKEFKDKYFPKKVNGPKGDVIDGTLEFETSDGTYKLKKEWESGTGTCRLTLPDGTSIKDNDKINQILADVLIHRSGVYGQIIFPSQKRDQLAIESIMRTLDKKEESLVDTREALTSTLTQAVLETGGVSLDKIEKALNAKMSELIGRWDLSADAPEGGAGRASYKNAWKAQSGIGIIAKAYYEVDRSRSEMNSAEKAEKELEAIKSEILHCQRLKKDIEAERSEFQKFRSTLGQRTLLKKSISVDEGLINEQRDVLKRFPKLKKASEEANDLRMKRKQAVTRELYVKVQNIQIKYSEEKKQFDKLKEVEQDDINKWRNLSSRLTQEKSKLVGMNITAKIKPLGDNNVDVRIASSDAKLPGINGEYDITEAVDITVPGVLEMSLTPKGIDLEQVKALIEEAENDIQDLQRKYSVSTLDELQALSDNYSESKRNVSLLENELNSVLGETNWEALEAENGTIPKDISSVKDIDLKIHELCGSATIDEFIGGNEAVLSGYKSKYDNEDELENSIKSLEDRINESQEKLDRLDNVPEKFAEIKDPDEHDSKYKKDIDDYDKKIDELNINIQNVFRNMDEKSAEEYAEELQQKEEILKASKAEYMHWQSIYTVFSRLKENTAGNPVEDIEEKFREYLEMISDGGLKLNAIDEQLSVKLASGNHELTYDILSEGTKDTIALAFRLAMLEHLYPDGDGLAIFDDPFTDMDPRRVEVSCKLIQKYAEKNQVIFITCDEKYKKLMPNGNIIKVSK